ncbi:MAG: hypothetical protein QHH14_04315 [Clostridiales bacterium]|nr:hypothetical protein [Clostridiales bacterium]
MGRTADPKIHFIICLLILLTINLAAFMPSMRGDFLWDDKYFISENPNIQAAGFLKNFLVSPFGGFSGLDENSARMDRIMQFYRPLTSFSYWLDFKVWGLNPAAFHLTNILLHTVNTILLMAVLLALGIPRLFSFAAALLFSIFPLHFENVAWISGRTDLLAFFFGAQSVLLLIKFLKTRRSLYMGLSSFFFLFSLLAKESTILVPAVFLVVFYKKETKPAKAIISILPYAGALLAWFILRTIALGSAGMGYSGRTPLDFFAAAGFYTIKLLAPFNLSVTINPVPVFRSFPYMILGAVLTALFLVCVFWVVSQKWEKSRAFLTVTTYFLFLLPPLAAIFSAGTISILAWRFLYLPSAVLTAGLAWAVFRFMNRRALALVFLAFVLLSYGFEIYPKNALYGNEEVAFWQSFTNIEREDVLARFNIGVKGLALDEKKSLTILNEILADRTQPLHGMLRVRIYEELGAFYTGAKRFDLAEHYFNEIFKIQPTHSMHFYFNYAFFLGLSGRAEEGEKLVSEILRQFRQNHYVLTRAAKFYLIIKDYAKAAEFYSRDYNLFRTKKSLALLQELELLLKKPS